MKGVAISNFSRHVAENLPHWPDGVTRIGVSHNGAWEVEYSSAAMGGQGVLEFIILLLGRREGPREYKGQSCTEQMYRVAKKIAARDGSAEPGQVALLTAECERLRGICKIAGDELREAQNELRWHRALTFRKSVSTAMGMAFCAVGGIIGWQIGAWLFA